MVDNEVSCDDEITAVLVSSDVAVITIDTVCDAEGELEIDKLTYVVRVAKFDDDDTGDIVDDVEVSLVSVIIDVADDESIGVRD